MYVGTRKRWGMGRLAGAHSVRGLGRVRGRKPLGDMDWSSIITDSIDAAAATAQVALKPPTFSSIQYPNGMMSTQMYGSAPNSNLMAAGLPGMGISNLITPNLILFGGLGVVAVLLLSRK